MEVVSIPHTVTRNSACRRRALVSNWACMRLESATRTLIASEGSADERIKLGLLQPGPSATRKRNGEAIVGTQRRVYKETRHYICGPLSNRESRPPCGKISARVVAGCARCGRNSIGRGQFHRGVVLLAKQA